ncbi:MAG: hypothetical protein ABIQ30_09285 [Devosia sp.]
MTFKQWNAAIMIVGQILVTIWLARGGWQLPGVDQSIAGTAVKLLWVVGFMIAWNIVLAITIAILVGIVTRRELVDEPDDERDRVINLKASRNAYFAVSIGGLIALLLFALKIDPIVGVYVVFGALMLGGLADSASRLVYYRIG